MPHPPTAGHIDMHTWLGTLIPHSDALARGLITLGAIGCVQTKIAMMLIWSALRTRWHTSLAGATEMAHVADALMEIFHMSGTEVIWQ